MSARLDTYREAITPEGIALHLPAAGPVPRAWAWLLDLGLRLALLLLGSGALALLGEAGMGFLMIVQFLIFWAYPIVLEACWNGQTVGKRVLGLRVVAADGAPVGWVAAIVRNLLRTVDMLPLFYATGLVASLCDSYGRRLGDMVAGTLVVHTTVPVRRRAKPTEGVLAPALALRPAEQAAVMAFGERADGLHPERQAELAALARPITHATGAEGVRRLYAIANYLVGRP